MAIELISKAVPQVLEEYRDMMPSNCQNNYLHKRKVDYKFELELGAKPPTRAPYHMFPSELEEL